MTLCTGWVRPSNTLRPSTWWKEGVRFHSDTEVTKCRAACGLLKCQNRVKEGGGGFCVKFPCHQLVHRCVRSWYPPWTARCWSSSLYGRKHSCSLPMTSVHTGKLLPLQISTFNYSIGLWFWPCFAVFFPLSREGFWDASLATRAQQRRTQSPHSTDYRSVSSAHAHWAGERSQWGAAFKRFK